MQPSSTPWSKPPTVSRDKPDTAHAMAAPQKDAASEGDQAHRFIQCFDRPARSRPAAKRGYVRGTFDHHQRAGVIYPCPQTANTEHKGSTPQRVGTLNMCPALGHIGTLPAPRHQWPCWQDPETQSARLGSAWPKFLSANQPLLEETHQRHFSQCPSAEARAPGGPFWTRFL